MRRICPTGLAAAGLLLLLPGAPPLAAQDFGKLKFMAGCWQGILPDRTVVEEWWMPPVEKLTLGVTRYLFKKGEVRWDFNRVEQPDSTVLLILQSQGETPDTFRLRTLVDEAAIWERGGSDFPLRVMYRLTSDKALIARVEGDENSTQDLELRMDRAKCPNR